jgi:hypothetical protein
MAGEQAPSSKAAFWLKALGVVITSIGGAIGSYNVSRSDSKQEAEVSFELMKASVEKLEQNQKMVWDVLMRQQSGTAANALPALPPITSVPAPATNLSQSRGSGIGLGRIGTLGRGAGSGTGQGFGSGSGRMGSAHRTAAAVADAPKLEPIPVPTPLPQLKPLPKSLNEAMQQRGKD